MALCDLPGLVRAGQRMAERALLVVQLRGIDAEIVRVAALKPSHRVCHDMLRLLEQRTDCENDLRAVGYEPWQFPLDIRESKAV